MIKKFCITLLLFVSYVVHAQEVYRTPSGKKYHLSTCRMVENVSKKNTINNAISKYGLRPCKICKPPVVTTVSKSLYASNKAVGKAKTIQCIGYTKKGTRCKHKTSLGNGYCFQHTAKKNSKSAASYYKKQTSSSYKCGARTKSGKPCKRRVKQRGSCYQHD